MLTITISRSGGSRHGAPKDRRALPWRRIVLGVLAAVVLLGGIAWGVSYMSSAPQRNYMEIIKAEDVASGDPEPSDAEVLESMNNDCANLRGKSMDTFLTRDPAYQPKTVTRDEYVAAADEYCASRG